MLIGYMRVSSNDERQSVALQRDALLAAGVDQRHLHQDRASGARDDRPALKSCLAELCEVMLKRDFCRLSLRITMSVCN